MPFTKKKILKLHQVQKIFKVLSDTKKYFQFFYVNACTFATHTFSTVFVFVFLVV